MYFFGIGATIRIRQDILCLQSPDVFWKYILLSHSVEPSLLATIRLNHDGHCHQYRAVQRDIGNRTFKTPSGKV